MRKLALLPTMDSRSMSALAERAWIDSEKRPEMLSWTSKRRTSSEVSPDSKVSSSSGIASSPVTRDGRYGVDLFVHGAGAADGAERPVPVQGPLGGGRDLLELRGELVRPLALV